MFTGHSLLHTHKSDITGLSAVFSILSPPPPSFPSCMFILLLCISHIMSSLAVCWPVSLSSPQLTEKYSLSGWDVKHWKILAFLKEAICFLFSNVSHAVKWHWLVPPLTKSHRDGLSKARESFEEWVSSLLKYPNYHFLWETRHHLQRSQPSGKVTRLKGHPSPFPVGTPPSSLTCSSRAVENSN